MKSIDKKSTQKVFSVVLFLCLSGFISSSAYTQPLQTVAQVAVSGAPGLAMHLLDQQQKYLSAGSKPWLLLERQRQKILQQWQQWQKGLQHLQKLPTKIPKADQIWAKTLQAKYLVELQRYDDALQLLRNLIWQEDADKKQLAQWQKMIIRVYLQSNHIRDAERAMLRYQQDYQDKQVEWLLLQAQILIRTDRADEVEELEVDQKDDRFTLYRLLAQLNSKKVSSDLIYSKAKVRAEDEKLDKQLRLKYWLLAARASYIASSPTRVALSYDYAARLAATTHDPLFPFSGDQLWDAYLALGHYAGNRKRLLLGDDEQWFKEADKALPNFPITAKALLSVVALQSNASANKKRAFNKLVALIMKQKQGMLLLKKLFLDSERFAQYDKIPHQARYLLVDDALAENEIVQASRLISHLTPPKSADAFKWELRRARILIMGADFQQGIEVLRKLINSEQSYSSEQIDQITQVLFDLQAVEQHKATIELFDDLLNRPISPKRKREIYFWQAQSWSKLNNHEDAALMYLQSAWMVDKGNDPWGQTARFNAAEELSDAGLIGDAQRVFQALLKQTRNKKRRAVIRSRLKGLWLKLKNEQDIAAN